MNLEQTATAIVKLFKKPNESDIQRVILVLKKYTGKSMNEILYDAFIPNKQKIGYEKIMQVVCGFYGIDPLMLKNETRKKVIVIPRQVNMYFLEKYTDLSLSKIASIFDKRTHATVIHAIKTINDLRDTDKSFKLELETIDKLINEI